MPVIIPKRKQIRQAMTAGWWAAKGDMLRRERGYWGLVEAAASRQPAIPKRSRQIPAQVSQYFLVVMLEMARAAPQLSRATETRITNTTQPVLMLLEVFELPAQCAQVLRQVTPEPSTMGHWL